MVAESTPDTKCGMTPGPQCIGCYAVAICGVVIPEDGNPNVEEVF